MVAPLTGLDLHPYPPGWLTVVRSLFSPSSEDSALVAAMVAGDRDALGELYDRYSSFLLALGCRMVGDQSEAEEVVQEVFVETWRAAPTYDVTRGSVRAWLATRMRSRCLDRLKSVGRARRVGIDQLPPDLVAPTGPAGSAEGRRLASAMEDLSPDQRAVLELAYFEDLSSSEIAARLGVPIGTVKSRTAAALGRLRAALGAV